MIYTVIYYDEEDKNRKWIKFVDFNKAKQFSNENVDSEILVSINEYETLNNKLNSKTMFLKDIKNMIERNI